MKILISRLRKLDGCFFLNYGFRSDSPEQFYWNTSVGRLKKLLKLVIEFWTVTSNHKIDNYSASANQLFLIKNIISNGFY